MKKAMLILASFVLRFAKLHPKTFNMEPYRRDMFCFNLFADPTMWFVKEPEVKDEN